MTYNTKRIDISMADFIRCYICDACGSVVWDQDIHDKWHEENNGSRTVSAPDEGATEITNW